MAFQYILISLSLLASFPDDPSLLAHWRLDGDLVDRLTPGRESINHGVRFVPGGRGGATASASFDGQSAHFEIPDAAGLRPGEEDFTIAFWMHTEANLDDDPGDLVSFYEGPRSNGLSLASRTNSGVTSCQANARQLQFGIDAASEPRWTDVGRPGDAILAFALVTHEGWLYAGTCTNRAGGTGCVHRYDGEGGWLDLGPLDGSNAVTAFAAHDGSLYAGTGRYRFGGSSLAESENLTEGGAVFRLDRSGRWVAVGRLPGTVAVGGLVSYRGRLHASSLYPPAGFYRLEQDGTWKSLPVPGGKRVEPLSAQDGFLYAGSYDGGRVYRYDGEEWSDLGVLGENTQTYSFAVHGNRLMVGTWPSGRVYRREGDSWSDTGRLGEELEVMGLMVHNGSLYGGTLPLAEVHRLEANGGWRRAGRLDETPEVKYRRVWTMAEYRGRLYCSTLPSGHVWALEAGPSVSHDHELAPGWRHVAAVKAGGELILHVDGIEVSRSGRFDPSRFRLDPATSLKIGAGAGGTFRGRLSDLRWYKRALSADEVRKLAAP